MRREAEAIAKKLEANIKKGSNHMVALVKWRGALIATFGIRHDKKAGHAHIPKQLFISQNEAIKMANCHISKEEYFEIIAKKGKLPTIN